MLAILASLILQSDPVVLEVAEKASPADVQAAAKAIERRCQAYGFEGATATVSVNGRKVLVSMPGTMSEDVRHRVELLAYLPGNKVEIRFHHPMTEAQRIQFANLYGIESMKNVKAPAGADWGLSLIENERSPDEKLLAWVNRGPLEAFSEALKIKGPHLTAQKESNGWRFEIPKSLLDELHRRKEAGKPKDMRILVDGYVVGWVKMIGQPNDRGMVQVEVDGPLVAAFLSAKMPDAVAPKK